MTAKTVTITLDEQDLHKAIDILGNLNDVDQPGSAAAFEALFDAYNAQKALAEKEN